MSTILQIATADRNLSTLIKGFKATNLEETLNGVGPFTILAPVNLAFNNLNAPDTFDDLVKQSNKNTKLSEHFPEHNVKVVQIGGYTLLQTENRKHIAKNDLTKLIAFISHDENEIDFYTQLPFYNRLNIYQPYYESCSYGHVLEFFVPEMDAAELVRQIKQRRGAETGIYKECLMYHL